MLLPNLLSNVERFEISLCTLDGQNSTRRDRCLPSGVEEVIPPEKFKLDPVRVLGLRETLLVLGEVLNDETRGNHSVCEERGQLGTVRVSEETVAGFLLSILREY